MVLRFCLRSNFCKFLGWKYYSAGFISHKMNEYSCIVAVCQMTATINKENNLKIVHHLINEAKKLEAKMIFFPEACDFIGGSKKEILELAETMDGPLMTTYKDLALKNNLWISVGGFHELADTNNEVSTYNTHVIIDNTGKIQATYRKLHLFDVVIPEQNIDLCESKVTKAGNNIVEPIETPAGYLGLSICYDIRFPAFSYLLRKMGATLLTYPSAFTNVTGEVHWETLLRARAIENQCYVIAAAQVGVHNPKRTSHGHAMIVDPWGKIIAECPKYSGKEEPAYLKVAEISSKCIETVRERMPVINHVREDIYNVQMNKNTETFDSKTDLKFSDKVIPASTIFYQTKLSFAFTNIRCVLPGHVLVASKRVARRLKDLTPEEVADLFQSAVKIQNIMESVHNANSTTLVVQDGRDAGQTVPHVHCHILPRKPGDFDRNDDIYEALARHDAADSKMPVRDISEMVAEATHLKKIICIQT